MKPDDRLSIEKLGGFAGIGLPGSRIRCRALLVGKDLTAEEQGRIAALFATPRRGVPAGRGADRFRFRIVWHNGTTQREVEVDEDDLVDSLLDRLQDELI